MHVNNNKLSQIPRDVVEIYHIPDRSSNHILVRVDPLTSKLVDGRWYRLIDRKGLYRYYPNVGDYEDMADRLIRKAGPVYKGAYCLDVYEPIKDDPIWNYVLYERSWVSVYSGGSGLHTSSSAKSYFPVSFKNASDKKLLEICNDWYDHTDVKNRKTCLA